MSDQPGTRVYPRPPIVEAVIEFRFAEAQPLNEMLDAIGARLQATYSGKPHDQFRTETKISISPDGPKTEATTVKVRTFLKSADGSRLVGCGDTTLSVHVLAPYPGWQLFLGQAKEAAAVLPEIVRSARLTEVMLRYVDQLRVPNDAVAHDYLNVLPNPPLGFPQPLKAFQVMVESADETTKGRFTVASTRTQDNKAAFVTDAILTRPLLDTTLALPAWEATLQDLHAAHVKLFEATITDKARSLFQ